MTRDPPPSDASGGPRPPPFDYAPATKRASPALRRIVGAFSVMCVGIGGAIGSGIFATPGEAARLVASPWLILLLWLAGGLIPSTSALLILLGAIAAGRPTFGLVLVVAFGLGMAAVMSGIGLVLVTARDRVDRVQARAGLVRVRDAVPLVASVVVLGFGVVLTGQALAVIGPLGL